MARLGLVGVVKGADPKLIDSAGQIPLVVEPDLVFNLAVAEEKGEIKGDGEAAAR